MKTPNNWITSPIISEGVPTPLNGFFSISSIVAIFPLTYNNALSFFIRRSQ